MVSWFSLQLLSERFLILRRIKRDIIKCIQSLHIKYPLFFCYLNKTWIFSTDFRKILKYQLLWKSSRGSRLVQGERTDGKTEDRHDEPNFSSFFAILRRHLKCLSFAHAVHLHISMIFRTIFYNFLKHKQGLFQYNHCFDKRLNPNLKKSAAIKHVDFHVKCLLCLKSFSAKWHVSKNFSKIPNIKFTKNCSSVLEFLCRHTSSGADEITSIWVLQECESTYKLINCCVRFM